jgi:hypothetical protein
MPTLRNVTAVTWATNGSVTPSLPSGTAEGDLLIALVFVRNTSTVNATSGWTTILDSGTDSAFAHRIMAKVAGSSESAPTFTSAQATTQPTGALLSAWHSWSGNISDLTVSGVFASSSGTPTLIGITTDVDNSTVLRYFMCYDDNSVTAEPSGLTAVTYSGTTLGSDAALGLWYSDVATAGEVSDVTFTMSGSDPFRSVAVSIEPAASGNRTATPAVINVTTSMPAVSGGATATPAVISVSTTMPAVTLSQNATATPAVINATTNILPARVDNSAAPATVNVTFSIPAPTVSVGQSATAAPAVITSVVAVPAAGAGSVVLPGAIMTTVTMPSPTVESSQSALAEPTEIHAASYVIAPNVSISIYSFPDVVLTPVEIPAAFIGELEPLPDEARAVAVLPALVATATAVSNSAATAEPLLVSAATADPFPVSPATATVKENPWLG